jgi:hypothetical protein
MPPNRKSRAPLAQGEAHQSPLLLTRQSRQQGRRTAATIRNPAPLAASPAEVISLGDIASQILKRIKEAHR